MALRLTNRRREERVANAVIADPEEHTTMDRSGAVRSIQAANIDMPVAELDQIWDATNLERLARTYWWYLSRISLGLIRVHYSYTERSVVVLGKPLVLLRFHPPEYQMTADRGIVRWRIRDGLLVARKDDGHLEIDVRRSESERPGYARAHVEVEVASFYPALARPFRWLYTQTQSRIHVIVTHGFLRHLARLELEESAVGRFAPEPLGAGANGRHAEEPRALADDEDVTVGSTPWGVVAAAVAAAAAAATAAWALLARRR
jgi:hypothetical protein